MKKINDTEWRNDVTGGHVRHLNNYLLRLLPVQYAVKGVPQGFKKGYRALFNGIDIPFIRGFKRDIPKMKAQMERLASKEVKSSDLKAWASMKEFPADR